MSGNLAQRLQFFPLESIPPASEAERVGRGARPEHLVAQLPAVDLVLPAFDVLALSPDPELHAKRVEPAFGDYYVVCSCGFLSLPKVYEPDRLVCEVEEGEEARARNRQRFRARQIAGR